MREPPLGLDEVPHPALEAFFDEILCAPTTEELVNATYQGAVQYLTAEIEAYQRETNPLADAPSRRALRFALVELHDMHAFGVHASVALPGIGSEWMNVLDALFEQSNGADNGTPRQYSVKPYVYDPIPKRDERFRDPWNQG